MNTAKPALSVDAFHRGRFFLVQPKSGAHRAGLDAMLLAACVNGQGALRVADFGAGAGAAGFAVGARLHEAEITLIERDAMMIECAAQSLALAENQSISSRACIVQLDLETAKPNALGTDHFDWVIMNPPFNEVGDRQSPHAIRADAHVLTDDLFEVWLKRAASALHAKGRVALIARPSSIPAIISAAQLRFGAMRLTPVHARPGQEAIRILITGQKGNKKRLSLGPPIVLHEAEGHDFTAQADALINGQAALDG